MNWRSDPRPRLRCRAVARLLQQYLDGELDDPRGVLVADHLDECRRCGLEAETWRWLKDCLQGLRPCDEADRLERLRACVDGLAEPRP